MPSNLTPGLRPVPEITTPIPLTLSGKLPSYLHKSTLYRNGPARYDIAHTDGKTTPIHHWFDGFALVHAFKLDAETQSVTYQNRNITSRYQKVLKSIPKNKAVFFTFGRSDPCRSFLGKFFQLFMKEQPQKDPLTDEEPANCAVTIQTIPGKGEVIARTDHCSNTVLDPETLEVDHFFNFSGLSKELAGIFSAAHGHYDQRTAEFFNFNFDMKGPGKVEYKVFAVDKAGVTRVLATFEDRPAYLHSFAVTDNYVVLCVWPCFFDAWQVLWNRSLMDGMRFDKEAKTTFYVVSRNGGLVAKYESDPFFCFHTVNAFEKDGDIHIDLARYDDISVLDHLSLKGLNNPKTNYADFTLARFSLENLQSAIEEGPEKVQQAREKCISELPCELPRIHPDLAQKEYRYVYGTSNRDGEPFSEIAKVDVKSGERWTWKVESGVVGEPIFVNDPQAKEEDDGVLLVVVLDSIREKSDLVVLDARGLTEIARASVPQPVPLGFHGMYRK